MALTAVFFPESRSLDLSEADPYHCGAATAWYASTALAAAAYDPAYVIPTAAALLAAEMVTAADILAAGWLPLLLRSLAAQDCPLRCGLHPVHTSFRGSYLAILRSRLPRDIRNPAPIVYAAADVVLTEGI
jgi:hypothetical protein